MFADAESEEEEKPPSEEEGSGPSEVTTNAADRALDLLEEPIDVEDLEALGVEPRHARWLIHRCYMWSKVGSRGFV